MDPNVAKVQITNAKDGQDCIHESITYLRRLQKASTGDALCTEVDKLMEQLKGALVSFSGLKEALEARAKA